ncbi:hypothetical protein [uncultured Roseobacter sp.]|uniref:hypothetical protein n=1 Tax=uncultured Roseobacter sp. TaxID=114847 RepID=UPI00261F6C3A|nr:hypothetical protein [uncultured Roseobacter sp.]
MTAVSGWPAPARRAFEDIRTTVLDAASEVPDLRVVETLKWGEPSWLPENRRTGSTLRAAWKPALPDQISLFVNCNSAISATILEIYPTAFVYGRNRALRMPLSAPLPTEAIAHCAVLTLTWHRKTA